MTEIEIVYKNPTPEHERQKVTKSIDAYNILKPLFKNIEHREEMWVLLLNRSNKVLGSCLIGIGGLTECIVDLRVVFQVALKANASQFILCHNHPSGNLNASDADIAITNKIKNAGIIMNIKLLDHIIITDYAYTSLQDIGMI